MKRTSTIFVVSASAAILLLADSCICASMRKVDVKTGFEKEGFTLIGHMSPDNATKNSLNSIGTKAIDLYLSGENAKETQIRAVAKCRDLMGTLLFILTDQQFNDVQLETHGIGEPFWSSAVYDENGEGTRFSYLVNGVPVKANHIRPESGCRQTGNGMGLVVQGSMSNYGLCSARSDTRLRYICRV